MQPDIALPDDHASEIHLATHQAGLSEYYANSSGISSGCDVLNSALNHEEFALTDFPSCNQSWTQPTHTESYDLCDVAYNEVKNSFQDQLAGQSPQSRLQYPDFRLDEFRNSSTYPLIDHATPFSDREDATNLLNTVMPDDSFLIYTAWNSDRCPHFNGPPFSGALTLAEEDPCGLLAGSLTLTSNQSTHDVGLISRSATQDGSLLMTSKISSESQSSKIGPIEPAKVAETFPMVTPSHNQLFRQPLLRPEFQRGFNMSDSDGILDQYIYALGDFIKHLEGLGRLTPAVRDKHMATGVLWVVREAWPQAEHFWEVTASFQGFLQAEVWRNFPYPSVYQSMHPVYRPTVTQLSIPHSPIIDWLPWPDLRDKLITSKDHINVDLVCKLAIQNVVAHRRKVARRRDPKRVCRDSESNPAPTLNKTSFRIWDLCILEEKAGARLQESPALTCRPRSAPVRALEKAYGLKYDDFQTQKLHPEFFNAFPNLLSESAVSDPVVLELPALRRYTERDVLGAPQPMSPGSMERSEAMGNPVMGVTS
ncbi:hypothetical protein LTR99_008019 [Exophiala xenobiotica]|uniref:Uncharacterized protein n=1 Tax=Vermiconidia calcicola TaxID=1690605 RepID=A0AAV9Q494_9PEZI|nr:hypothetical protein LTR99_008019 [Exophiala xenobiotica]KAK5429259.1 hypothetical protein LTR34_007719 [Exophiala xenobiotica]KAK5535009.1 hypothetical protein LTR25_006016 [Vermiconidia calcicola]KAK5536189.1 hypothetical protein LTR23_008051 [Chaetothyriales sp. CCFEE 6169]